MLYNACKHFVEINAPVGKESEIYAIRNAIIDVCAHSGISYAMIIHDRDTNEDGSLKKIHIHLYINGSTRIKSDWIISSIRECMVLQGYGFNDNQFSDRRVISEISCLQYLIHKNNTDKFQYSINNVVCNDDRLLQKIVDGIISIDEHKLIYLVQCLDYCELLSELGIEYCRLNHNVIMQLYKLKKGKDL